MTLLVAAIILIVAGGFLLGLLFDLLALLERAMSAPRVHVTKQTNVTLNAAAPPPPKTKRERAEEEKRKLKDDLEIIEEADLPEDVKEDAKEERTEKYAYRIDEIMG